MYLTTRRYRAADEHRIPEIARRVAAGLVPLMRGISGFREYHLVDVGHGAIEGVAVFDSRAGAEASNREAAAWVSRYLLGELASGPEIEIGRALLSVSGRTGAESPGGAGETVGVVREMVSAFNERRFDSAVCHLAPRAECVWAATRERFEGRAGYLDALRRWTTALPDARLRIVDLVGGTDSATVQYDLLGTHEGTLDTAEGPIGRTGRRLELRVCEVLRFRAGQVTRMDVYFDTAALARQLGEPGAGPEPPRLPH